MPQAVAIVPKPHGVYPLTLLDDISTELGLTMGWFVEGIIDLGLISAALDRLIAKWPILAGRLESVSNNHTSKYQIRFPAGSFPKDYAAYALTSTVSTTPISDYFSLPLPVVSASPPKSIFIHSSTPCSSASWASRQHLLTCWHITYFPYDGQGYSCIGVSFSHGLLDDIGLSYLIRALETEMRGCEWETPLHLHEGLNANMLQESLNVALEQSLSSAEPEMGDSLDNYSVVIPGTILMAITFVLWHVWQRWWHGARAKVFILPPKVFATLVDRVMKDIEDGGLTDVRPSTSDILAAWFFKTMYSDGTPCSTTVHCANMTDIRHIFPEALNSYCHNCFLPIPYPTKSVGEIQSTPLHVLSYSFAAARSPKSLSLAVPVATYGTCLSALKDKSKTIVALIPHDPMANEPLAITNMSAAPTVNTDWTAVGGKSTVCRYKYVVAGGPMYLTNHITISGCTHDGHTVVDVVLSKRRLARLEAEVQRLVSSTV